MSFIEMLRIHAEPEPYCMSIFIQHMVRFPSISNQNEAFFPYKVWVRVRRFWGIRTWSEPELHQNIRTCTNPNSKFGTYLVFLPFLPQYLLQCKATWRSIFFYVQIVCFRYVPASFGQVVTNNMLFTTPETERIKHWICGPCQAGRCPIGERVCGCCAHVATAIFTAACVANDHSLFRSTHRNLNILDRRHKHNIHNYSL